MLINRVRKILKAFGSQRLFKALFCYRTLIAIEHLDVLKRRKFNTVIDIGANKGQFSLAISELMPKASIIAFEPLHDAAETYRKIFRNDSKVTLHQVAIGSEQMESIIHISKADDSSSLLSITPLQAKLFPGTEEVSTEVIQVKRLSDLISGNDLDSPILLKLDVQGYELEVISGCKELISIVNMIIVECSFMELYKGQALAFEVIRYLDSFGFIFHNIYNLEFDKMGKAIQGDFVFTKNNSITGTTK